MARGKRGKIPKNSTISMEKAWVLDKMLEIDRDPAARDRVLQMDSGFQKGISTTSVNLNDKIKDFIDMNTSPFVLMAYAYHHRYGDVAQIEREIGVAKEFSSIETSLGRMIEAVTLPVYGWEFAPSEMDTPYSVIDGKLHHKGIGLFATLKSGPRCINDDQVKGLSNSIVENYPKWASDMGVENIDFTIGILYGTYKQSQKKDWHIIDKVCKSLVERGAKVIESPDYSWKASFAENDLKLSVTVRIGMDWWEYVGRSEKTFLEVSTALVRSCIRDTPSGPNGAPGIIPGFKEVVSMDGIPSDYNISLLPRWQLPWLFLVVSHFTDKLVQKKEPGPF